MNKQQVKMMRSKTVEEYLATPMISKITGGRPEVYRVYIEDMLTVCKDLTDVTSDMSKYGHAMYCIMDPEGYVKDIGKIIS